MTMNKKTIKRVLLILAIVLVAAILIFFGSNIIFDIRYNNSKDTTQTYIDSIVVEQIESSFIMSEENDLIYISPYEQHFVISGFEDPKQLVRLSNADEVSKKVASNADSTAGGRVMFCTNSNRLSVKVELKDNNQFKHFPLTNTSGCDIYVGKGIDKVWKGNLAPKNVLEKRYDGLIEFEDCKMHEITICLPTYSSIKSIQIGLDRKSKLTFPTEYSYTEPMVFYGSSITQGCASNRPGTCYPELVSRYFDANLYNLGFSSGAKGEQEIADYLATLEMTALIIEYDHNASSVEELEKTHYNLYSTIRQSNKNVPIVLLHRFSGGLSVGREESIDRFKIVQSTYMRALQNGDKNIYFIQSDEVIPEIGRDNYFVDGVHPNDLGMKAIANAVIQLLDEVLDNEDK